MSSEINLDKGNVVDDEHVEVEDETINEDDNDDEDETE